MHAHDPPATVPGGAPVVVRAHPTIGILLLGGVRDRETRLPLYPTAGIALADGATWTESTVREARSSPTEDIHILKDGKELGEAESSRMRNMIAAIASRGATPAVTVRVDSHNENVLSGSSDSAAASIGVAAELALGLHLPREEMADLVRLGSESAFRAYYGGLTLTEVGESGTRTRELLTPSDLSTLSILALGFDVPRHSADEIHAKIIRHPDFSARVTRSAEKARELERLSTARDLLGILHLAQEDSRDFHRLLEGVGVNVITPEMRPVLARIEEMAGRGLPVAWIVTGGSVVYTLFLERAEAEIEASGLAASHRGIVRRYKVAGGAHRV